jgi:hypothetical protein
VLNIVHERLLEDAFEGNTAVEIDILDKMIDHFKEVVVVKEVADTAGSSLSEMSSGSGAIKLSPKNVGVELGTQDKSDSTRSHSRTATGTIRHRIHFGGVSGPMRQVVRGHNASRCWILLDEWSGVPLDLQPFLAEMLRRLFFGIPKVTVRLGAIAHRSNFRISDRLGQYLGVEVGAELFPLLDLDEFVVFPARSRAEQSKRSLAFFKNLFFRHLNRALRSLELETLNSPDQLVSLLFTAALRLTQHGFFVFPLRPGDK